MRLIAGKLGIADKLASIWALVALLAAASAPQGYMPDWQDGELVIGICSGSSNNQIAIDRQDPLYAKLAIIYASTEEQHPSDDMTMPDCAFAGVGLDFDLAPDFAVILPTASGHIAPFSRFGQALFQLYTQLPPSTGPPVLF